MIVDDPNFVDTYTIPGPWPAPTIGVADTYIRFPEHGVVLITFSGAVDPRVLSALAIQTHAVPDMIAALEAVETAYDENGPDPVAVRYAMDNVIDYVREALNKAKQRRPK